MSTIDAAVPLPERTETATPLALDVGAAATSERRALRVLQAGALFIVLAAITWKTYELDRFFIPKELVLHSVALYALLLVRRSARRLQLTWIDGLLALHVALGIASSVLATNHWLAVRALAVSASGLAVFWSARVLRSAGLDRSLLGAVAVAVVAGCATSLLQAYGAETDFFSINRAPGGTFGNRNFVAHMAAFGLPVVLLVALTARRWTAYAAGALASTVVVATLFLTRSRAAWLAAAAVLLVLGAAMLFARTLRRDGRTWRRIIGILVLGAAGIAASLVAPNALDWRSDNPYLESMRDVANYEEGSGRGRLVQYRRTLSMAAAHPALGVGPGNWGVVYPEHAAPGDPSMNRGMAGMTSNPWPSSDWVAFVAERGLAAALLLVLAVAGLARRGLQQLFTAPDAERALGGAALLGTLAATVVAGMFDAVLLLALPTLLVWAAVGALYSPAEHARVLPRRLYPVASGTLLFVIAVGALRSASQLVAMGVHTETNDGAWLERAALVDPGNFRIRLQLARSGSGLERADRCAHAHVAHALYPAAEEAGRLSHACD